MKTTILAYSKENTQLTDNDMKELQTFIGKQAGICYMKDKYFGTYVEDPEKAFKRYNTVIQTGHHSIADHARITVLFEGISKIVAMVLNSVGDYNTSEKSGRYTEMVGNTEEEVRLYNKWLEIFTNRIKEEYPNFNDKYINKLAMENARYILSVFTPATTMSYTTSLRQFNYIIAWCERITSQVPRNYFESQLFKELIELRQSLIDAGLYTETIEEFKGRGFAFLARQSYNKIIFCKDYYGDSYLMKYKATFAALAQEQRHRTLDYFMDFNGIAADFYIPKIIRGTKYEKEWYDDMMSVAHLIPQGTLVNVVETGNISNFILKCKERMCGRSQLEIMDLTIDALRKFEEKKELSYCMLDTLHEHIEDGKLKMKCNNLKCKEPCMFGPLKSQTRLI